VKAWTGYEDPGVVRHDADQGNIEGFRLPDHADRAGAHDVVRTALEPMGVEVPEAVDSLRLVRKMVRLDAYFVRAWCEVEASGE
jgi:hypothetical protein